MKINGFQEMLAELGKERGIEKSVLLSAVGAALVSACKRNYKSVDHLEAMVEDNGEFTIFAKKKVVEAPDQVEDPEIQISLAEARVISGEVEVGGEVRLNVTPPDFGRFAAATAKQVILQRLREAEKETAFDEYSKKIGQLITGQVQRKEFNGHWVNLGRAETLLTHMESVPGETFRAKERIKVYVVDVKKNPRGPVVIISRSHPTLVKRLFEAEIPEIEQGILEVKGVVREPGRRTKITIHSHDKNVPAIGTCVGQMGTRIQTILKELGSERVDIVEWSEHPAHFIANALSPAKIVRVELDAESNTAKVIVAENQLSLAIGRDGQNVRLAARLTGWKLDILSESEAKTGKRTREREPQNRVTQNESP